MAADRVMRPNNLSPLPGGIALTGKFLIVNHFVFVNPAPHASEYDRHSLNQNAWRHTLLGNHHAMSSPGAGPIPSATFFRR